MNSPDMTPRQIANKFKRLNFRPNRAGEFVVQRYDVEGGEIVISLTKRASGKRAWYFAVRYRPIGRDFWNYRPIKGCLAEAQHVAQNIRAGRGKWW